MTRIYVIFFICLGFILSYSTASYALQARGVLADEVPSCNLNIPGDCEAMCFAIGEPNLIIGYDQDGTPIRCRDISV